MGQAKSKTLKYPAYPPPPGYPPYSHVYPYAVQPQVGYVQGYQAPVIPPSYAGPVLMPQPQITLQAAPRERRRRKRKSPPQFAAVQPSDQPRAAPAPANVQPAPPGMLDNLPPGFVLTSITPNPPGASATGPVIPPAGPGNNTAQGAYPPPLFTPGVPGNAQLTDLPSSEAPVQRRAATPFVPALPPGEASDDDDGDNRGQEHQLGRTHSRSHRRAASVPVNLAPILPEDPIASPGVSPNPLPQPPRDVYELTPYKQLLHLPNTMALLTATTTTNPQNRFPNSNVSVVRSATNPGMAGIGAGANNIQPAVKKKKRGFFSFGSRRGRDPASQSNQPQHQLGNIQFVPIYRDAPPLQSAPAHSSAPNPAPAPAPQAGPSTGEGTLRYQTGTPVPPASPPSPPPQRSPPPDDYDDESEDGTVPPEVYRSISPASHHSHHTSRSLHQQTQPPVFYQVQSQPSTSQPYIRSPNGSVFEFNHASLPDFLNHSPHRVMYQNKIYPSAMHLHEAMKFMEHKPELAESIRMCQDVEEVYPLTAKLQAWVRPDWGAVFVDKMEEVLWHKFTQHQDLRTMLFKTGNAKIVYSHPDDPYWGTGTDLGHGRDFPGTNNLGILLERVRERLRAAGYT
ncbi:Swarming motility protein YbiA [Leucoagaricus sp. SymC.cos]|nr:Swarming motility protein YbiA [Leucoagaricus sp. SymC.cos]